MLFFLVQESAGRMVSSERRMGDEMNHSLFAIRHVLENAQNGKGQLLAEVGMDLGSAPRSLGIGAECEGRAPLVRTPPRGPV
jgi:hypothetical protein